jgi:hypothetical protein
MAKRPVSSKISMEISKRLKEYGYVLTCEDYETAIFRTYSGRGQRSGGALSWWLGNLNDYTPALGLGVGSQYPATECLKEKKWNFFLYCGTLMIELYVDEIGG